MGFGFAADKEYARKLVLQGVELGRSRALGGGLRLELAPGTTVLVGRNGAGKSAILERIQQAFWNVCGIADSEPDPAHLACEFRFDDAVTLRYRCTWHPREEPVHEKVTGVSIGDVEEMCTIGDGPNSERLWTVQDGSLQRNDGTSAEVAPGRTLVNGWVSIRKGFVFNKMVGPLYEWFSSTSLIRPAITRVREEVIAPIRFWDKGRREPLQLLAINLARWQEEHPDDYARLLKLGRRTQVFEEMAIKRYLDPGKGSSADTDRKDFVTVAVDGVDLGLLSDGTLRGLHILVGLLDPEVRLLLIDEPENAAHPGLLARLLAEFEAYSDDRQIVLATQSPQVVNWARPDAVRLVERRDGATHVRALDPATLERVERYLHDEDTLGNFIYGGGIDGFAG